MHSAIVSVTHTSVCFFNNVMQFVLGSVRELMDLIDQWCGDGLCFPVSLVTAFKETQCLNGES